MNPSPTAIAAFPKAKHLQLTAWRGRRPARRHRQRAGGVENLGRRPGRRIRPRVK